MQGNATAVVGAQWGDEGKGKIAHRLAAGARTVVRFNGGANAGYTIVVGGVKRVLHLLPAGILREGTLNVVGPYVVCDPEVLVEELALAKAHGARILLDRQAPVVLPHHKQLDKLREGGSSGIGTTQRGIGPCYEDLAMRRGPQLGELVDRDHLKAALLRGGYYAERSALIRHHGGEPMLHEEVLAWAAQVADALRPHLGNARAALADGLNAPFLFEGVQGMLLDVRQGTWPYVTSSFCSPAAIGATLGVHGLDRIIGVAKAYVTRVGGGPFPTEAAEADGNWLREQGAEYGATTGRPRRCGWLDLPALRYACRAGGIREIALTKLDVLTGREEIPVCLHYEAPDGSEVWMPHDMSAEALALMKPHFITMRGWKEPLGGCRRFNDLPEAARDYVHCITRNLELPVTVIGVGPDDEQIVTYS